MCWWDVKPYSINQSINCVYCRRSVHLWWRGYRTPVLKWSRQRPELCVFSLILYYFKWVLKGCRGRMQPRNAILDRLTKFTDSFIGILSVSPVPTVCHWQCDVGEFDSCPRNVRKFTNDRWSVSGKLFIANLMFGPIPVFGSFMHGCLLYCKIWCR